MRMIARSFSLIFFTKNEKLRSTSDNLYSRQSLELLLHIIFDCTYLLPVNVNVGCSKDFIEPASGSDWPLCLHTQRRDAYSRVFREAPSSLSLVCCSVGIKCMKSGLKINCALVRPPPSFCLLWKLPSWMSFFQNILIGVQLICSFCDAQFATQPYSSIILTHDKRGAFETLWKTITPLSLV